MRRGRERDTLVAALSVDAMTSVRVVTVDGRARRREKGIMCPLLDATGFRPMGDRCKKAARLCQKLKPPKIAPIDKSSTQI